MNQVEMDMMCWIIVHEHTGIIDLSSERSKPAGLSRPYFFLSQLIRVYSTKKMRDTSSARLDPMAAPVMPRAGNPRWPKMSTQLKSMLERTMTTELSVRVFVCVVPT